MLAIWNRCELVIVLTMQEQSNILSALWDAGLDYAVRVIDRSLPSALNPGTRADFGTMGMSPETQYEYIIYVNKRDYDIARDVMGFSGDTHRIRNRKSGPRKCTGRILWGGEKVPLPHANR